MILRRFFTLAALVVAASLSLSGRANADYSYSTSVPTNQVTGGSNIGTGTGTIVLAQSGGTFMPGASQVPYTFFTDAGGSTIYLLNSSASGVPYGINTGSPNVNIYISTPVGVNDASTWSFVENIAVTNNAMTGTFQESAQYVMHVSSGSGNAQMGTANFVGPTSIPIGLITFSVSAAGTTPSVQVNNLTPASVSALISTVPEPASVVMLGAGLVGVVGFSLRPRKKQV